MLDTEYVNERLTSLPLLFVDLEPAENIKQIYVSWSLGNMQITVELPWRKNFII